MRVEQTTCSGSGSTGSRIAPAGHACWCASIGLIGGNPGQHRQLGGGVSELKIDVGPGYRVNYALARFDAAPPAAGGDKSTQQKDIAAATRLAQEFSEC